MGNQFKKIPRHTSQPDHLQKDGQSLSQENQSQQPSNDAPILPPGRFLPNTSIQELSPEQKINTDPLKKSSTANTSINSDPFLPAIDDLLTAQMPSVKLPPADNLMTAQLPSTQSPPPSPMPPSPRDSGLLSYTPAPPDTQRTTPPPGQVPAIAPQYPAQQPSGPSFQPAASAIQGRSGIRNFSGADYDPGFEDLATIPMMVLKDISTRKGQAAPKMESEISGSAGNAAFVGMGNILGTILKFGITLLIQRFFGPAIFGLYTLSTALSSLVSNVSTFGLDDAMVRYTAIYRSKEEAGSFRGLVIFCSVTAGLLGALGSLFMIFFTPVLISLKYNNLTGAHMTAVQLAERAAQASELAVILQWLAPLTPILVMTSIWTNGLTGFKDFRWRVFSQKLLTPGLLVISILVLHFYFSSYGIMGIIAAVAANAVISLVLAFWFFLGRFKKLAKAATEKYKIREWLSFSGANFMTNVTDIVLDAVDTLLLAAYITDVGIGLYGAAQKWCGFIGMPLSSLNAMFSPTIAELHAKGEKEKLEEMFKIVTKWTITFSLPIFGVVTLFSPYLLAISGPKFVEAAPLTVAFALGQLVNVGTGSVGYMLMMTGHQKASFINSLLTLGVTIALGLYLTPRYGAMGVAIATGAALALVNLLRLLQVRLLLKMQPYRRDTLKPVAAFIVSGVLIGIVLWLLDTTHFSLILLGKKLPLQMGLIPLFLICYTGILFFLGTSPEDAIVLNAMQKKLKKFGKGKGKKKK